MKPHPRIRKAIMGGGAAVTVLLVVVWIGSGWVTFWCRSAQSDVCISHGYVAYASPAAVGETRGLTLERSGPESECPLWDLRIRIRPTGSRYRWAITPLWLPTLPIAAFSAIAWRLDTLARRRARMGFCAKCGNDSTGLAAGAVCPECGARPAAD